MSKLDSLFVPRKKIYDAALEPAHNNFYTLYLLFMAGKYSGLNPWVNKTYHLLSSREKARHKLVIHGFYHAMKPEQGWPSFTEYVDHLSTRNPNDLREKMVKEYIRKALLNDAKISSKYLDKGAINTDQIFKDVDHYLDFLQECFGTCHELKTEAQAFSYLEDPPAMQDLIINHLRKMWDRYLAEEWEKNLPMLTETVQAFKQYDISHMNEFDIVKTFSYHEYKEKILYKLIEEAHQIIFIPSVHIGPYLGELFFGNILWIIFGARVPDGNQFSGHDINISQITSYLNAISDETRLRILKLVLENDEISSQKIMSTLNLSQSACSRHLKQLTATGYLKEHRNKNVKLFQMNPEKINTTLLAVIHFLTKK